MGVSMKGMLTVPLERLVGCGDDCVNAETEDLRSLNAIFLLSVVHSLVVNYCFFALAIRGVWSPLYYLFPLELYTEMHFYVIFLVSNFHSMKHLLVVM